MISPRKQQSEAHRSAIGGAALPILALICVVVGTRRAAAAESVAEIVRKANRAAYYQGDDGRANVHMTITDDQGRTRERRFTILRRDEPGEEDSGQKFYVYFHRPADVNKMVFMVWKHLDRKDDRWLYLPALDLVKRIAAGDERTSFVGSDFFYEDVSGRNLNEDRHELEQTTPTQYVLKNTPRDPDAVEFGFYRMWIDRQTFLPMKSEYFDRQGNSYRLYEVLEVRESSGFPTVTRAKMTSRKNGSHTVTEYSDVKYNVGLNERIFTERYLRRAPRSHLR